MATVILLSIFLVCPFAHGHMLHGGNFSTDHSLYTSYLKANKGIAISSHIDLTRFNRPSRSVGLHRGYPPILNIYTNAGHPDLISQFTESQVREIHDAIRIVSRYVNTNNKGIQLTIGIFKASTTDPTLLGLASRINNTHGEIHIYPSNIAKNIFFDVAIHEIIHILGFGSVEKWYTLIDNKSNFLGPLAVSYAKRLGQDTLPLETGYNNSGSDLAHWANKGLLRTDIMMAHISDPSFSAVSFAALTDAIPDWNILACVDNTDCTTSNCVHVHEFPSLCDDKPIIKFVPVKPSILLSFAAFVGSILYVLIYFKCNHGKQ